MGKKKKKVVLNLNKPSKGPTRRIINIPNINPYEHKEPASIDQSCMPEEINSHDLPQNDRLETEERPLNDEIDSPTQNNIHKNPKSDKSKLLSLDVSDMKPTSLNYSNNYGKSPNLKSDSQPIPKHYVHSESVSPNNKDGKHQVVNNFQPNNPYLERKQTPKLNSLVTIKQKGTKDMDSPANKDEQSDEELPPSGKRERNKKRVKSYLMFGRPSTDMDKVKLDSKIKPIYDIGEYKTLYHEDGYLWG